MQTIKTPVKGYAHCVIARCDGNEQEEVDAVSVETQYMFADYGAGVGGIERSMVLVSFADEADAICGFCGGPREVTTQKRIQYDPLSGFDQKYLVSSKFKPFSKDRQVEVQDGRVQELEDTVASLTGKLEALLSRLSEEPAPTEPQPEEE